MNLLKSVAVLVGGTALGHGITAAALPLLSRLYTPADFSLLAVFAGLVSIFSVVACLRFDIAVSLPEVDDEALVIVALAILSAVGVSLIVSLVVFLMPDRISAITNQKNLSAHLWLLPIGIFLAGAYSTLQAWFVRQKNFTLIARSRITQSASAAGAQLGIGAFGITPFGLLFGNILNAGSACIGLGAKLLVDGVIRQKILAMRSKDILASFRKYDRFPKFSAWEALFNSAAMHVPVIMIAAMAEGPEAGYLIFAMSVMQAPMALFGTAVGQVFISKAPDEHRKGNLASFSTEIFERLLKTGAGPLIAAGILAPVVFAVIFGAQWAPSGNLIAWMTPWFVMQFLATPISLSTHVVGRVNTAMIFQAFGLVLRVATIWLAHKTDQSLAIAFSVSNFVFYSLHLALLFNIVKALRIEVYKSLLSALPIILTMISFAILIACALTHFS